MKLLLDTQALILAGRDELPDAATAAFLDTGSVVHFSLASLWEIGIKAALGRLRFRHKLSDYHALLTRDLGLLGLAIEVHHIEKAVSLPLLHKDPFDRLIIGQALCEGLTVIASDAHFDAYGCRRIWQ